MSTTVTCSQRVGANFKRLLKEKNMSQEKFAEKANVSVRTVHRWVNDLDSVTNIIMVAKILEEDVTALIY